MSILYLFLIEIDLYFNIDIFHIGYPGVGIDWLSTLRENQSPHITDAAQIEKDLAASYDKAIARLHNAALWLQNVCKLQMYALQ